MSFLALLIMTRRFPVGFLSEGMRVTQSVLSKEVEGQRRTFLSQLGDNTKGFIQSQVFVTDLLRSSFLLQFSETSWSCL